MHIRKHLNGLETCGTETDRRAGNTTQAAILAWRLLGWRRNDMKTYYLIVRVGAARLVTYVRADSMASAFKAGDFKCRRMHPKLVVEVLAGQEVSEFQSIAI